MYIRSLNGRRMIVGVTSGKFLQPIVGLNLSFRPTELVSDSDFAKAWMVGDINADTWTT